MVKKRYLAVTAIVSALFMLYSVGISYIISFWAGREEYLFIIAGVAAVFAFAFSGFALFYSLKNTWLLLNIAVAVNSVVSIYCYVFPIIDGQANGIIGLFGTIVIGAFYYAGLVFKRVAQNKRHIFDLCSVLAICAISVILSYVLIYFDYDTDAVLVFVIAALFALAVFMVYSFVSVSSYVWYAIVGAAGVMCLVLSILYFVDMLNIMGCIALTGVAYTIVYYIITFIPAGKFAGGGFNRSVTPPQGRNNLSMENIR